MREVVDHCIQGFNTTIFAYGQTGSGKTHTLFGPEEEAFSGPNRGIIPRAIGELFSKLRGGSSNAQAVVYCSFLQIYNEELYDLLRDPAMRYSLAIHEDAKGDIYVDGLSQFKIKSVADAMALLDRGISYRATRSTVMNQVRCGAVRCGAVCARVDDTHAVGGRMRCECDELWLMWYRA
jgi:kinesin family protein 3/17